MSADNSPDTGTNEIVTPAADLLHAEAETSAEVPPGFPWRGSMEEQAK